MSTRARAGLLATPDQTRTPDLDALHARFPRVAIAHDWLTIPGGSEQVVLSLLELFPQAEVYTTVYDPSPWPALLREREVHASFLNRIPGAARIYPRLLPLMTAAWESFDLSAFDLVISSSHACAKNVLTPPETLHVCYCHTPMRYAWEPELLALEKLGPMTRTLQNVLTSRLRHTDFICAQRPDLYIANSRHVAARIRKYYRRESTVVHPPVDVHRFSRNPRQPGDYYLALGRVVPYKRVDIAVAACERLGRRLKVVGDGRALDAVRQLAGPNTEVLGRVDDHEVAGLLAGAQALLFPGVEDFGLVPVEAQAAGAPVVAYRAGGVLDSVLAGTTGVLYDDPTVDGLCEAILDFERHRFEEAPIREHAAQFGPDQFRQRVATLLSAAATSPTPA